MDRVQPQLSELTDQILCARAALGDRTAEETLILRYRRLVEICARPFYLAGGDHEDLIQEGMCGLLSAVRSFQAEKSASFRTFAEACIKNRILSAVRSASSGKHSPLNTCVSLETPLFAGKFGSCSSWANDHSQESAEDTVIGREALQERLGAVKGQLSGFETSVLVCYLNGLSYHEIADKVNRSPKSVDNAVQRIRRKLAQHFSFGEFSES